MSLPRITFTVFGLLEVKNKPFTTLRLTVLLKALARDEAKGHSSMVLTVHQEGERKRS